MNILLTGSNGFLGQEIKNKLQSFNIFELNRSSGKYKIELNKNIPVFQEEFNLVIHCAGKAHFVPRTRVEEMEFYEINVIGTKNLLKGLENSGLPEKFVFVSSVAVYGRNFGYLINENNPLQAKDPYGLSKIEAEKLVLDWCVSNNIKCTILRLPLIIGDNAPGNLRSMINGIKKGIYFNIAGGNARKSMVLSTDVANFIIGAAEKGGIYNLTDGKHPSFKELSDLIASQLKKKPPYNLPLWLAKFISFFGDVIGPNSPINSKKMIKITSDLTFDDSKAREILGWNPKPVLEGFKLNTNSVI